jgi:hypothetical protein
MSDADEWTRQLKMILDTTADTRRVLGIAENAIGVSDAVHGGAAKAAEDAFPRLVKLVRTANVIAARLGESPLTVPGEAPEVDLRPWWSRILEKVSSTARRNTVGQQLETLRLEADAALQRAAARR